MKKVIRNTLALAMVIGMVFTVEAGPVGTYSCDGLNIYVAPSGMLYYPNRSKAAVQMNCWDSNGPLECFDLLTTTGRIAGGCIYDPECDAYVIGGSNYVHTGGASDASKTWTNETYGITIELMTDSASGFSSNPGEVSGGYAYVNNDYTTVWNDGAVTYINGYGYLINISGNGYFHADVAIGGASAGDCINMY